jgi:hypothetical protein
VLEVVNLGENVVAEFAQASVQALKVVLVSPPQQLFHILNDDIFRPPLLGEDGRALD